MFIYLINVYLFIYLFIYLFSLFIYLLICSVTYIVFI